MAWREFCNVEQQDRFVFWRTTTNSFSDCGESIVCAPFLLISAICYAVFLKRTISNIGGTTDDDQENQERSHGELARLTLMFFLNFIAVGGTITQLVFLIYDAPVPVEYVLLGSELLVLLIASLCWLLIICRSHSMNIDRTSSLIGCWTIVAICVVRFYDDYQTGGFRPIVIVGLVNLVSQAVCGFSSILEAILSRGDRSIEDRDADEQLLHVEPRRLGPGDQESGFFSKITFYWTKHLMKKGYRSELKSIDDLYLLPDRFDLETLEALYNVQRGKLGPFSLARTLHRCFGAHFYSLGVLKFVADALAFAGPLFMNYLVNFMEHDNEPWYRGFLYAGGMVVASFISASCSLHFNYLMNNICLKVRGLMMSQVYQKVLAVAKVELGAFSSGEVMNFVSTDSDRLVNFCRSFHDFWSLPMQIAIALYLLYSEVGLAFLAGLGFAVILVPLNRWIAKKIGVWSTEMMRQKDNRVKLMTELLFGIRVVKYGAWEDSFTERVSIIRRLELKYLKGRKYLDALCVYLWASAPVIIAILTFGTYVLMGHNLTAAKVFTSIALFNILIMPLNAFPWVVNGVIEAWVSSKRLQRFLELSEVDRDEYYTSECPIDADAALCLHNANFNWRPEQLDPDPSQDKFSLSNLNITIAKGQLIGVIGTIGSGKSSLFAAILAEMRKDYGMIRVSGMENGLAYVGQEHWLQQGTIRQNILFGRPYMVNVYEAVVNACALTNDFQQMPAGDMNEVGEQGVTLSGGQKARLALARAVYQNKDIYLLDDPLSAVDAHVAKYLFDNCIRGLLAGKTVLLATHHVDYLRKADKVMIMQDGKITAFGTPDEIFDKESVAFQAVPGAELIDNQEGEKEDFVQPYGGEAVLVLEEEKEVGVIKGKVYATYLGAVGGLLTFSVFMALFLMQSTKNLSDWWLSFWVAHARNDNNRNNTDWAYHTRALPDHLRIISSYHYPYHIYPALLAKEHDHWRNITPAMDNITFYLSVYGFMIGWNTIFALFRAFLYAYGCICAARTLHDRLLNKVLKATTRFFDVTPVGRLVNRFSSDLYAIDDSLPFQANRLVACLFGLLGTLVMTCYGLPWFGLVILPMAVVYYFVQRYYRYTTCDLKRLTNISLSPIYSHFMDTLNGLMTVRAFRVSDRFIRRNRSLLIANQRAQFSALASSQWLAVRLQAIGVAMVGAVALIAVLQHYFRAVDPAMAALAISYVLSLTSILSGLLQAMTETEKEMVSVERVSEYVEKVTSEKWRGICSAPRNWPTKGEVVFKDVCLRYNEGTKLALDSLSFNVVAGEKIGIVGRTGSGKSSILQSLFRTFELESGQVFIDGVDISTLGLSELRSQIAVIPQTPYLFSGTLRENLDVESRYNEWRVQWAVELCGLDSVINRFGGLIGEIGERGDGLSLGEKQLICLARALLANAKIVCIDEATAHVDIETDQRIQRTLRTALPSATVLTIAHRIGTVIDYDRIFVMEQGRLVECGKPHDLMNQKDSRFAALAQSTL